MPNYSSDTYYAKIIPSIIYQGLVVMQLVSTKVCQHFFDTIIDLDN